MNVAQRQFVAKGQGIYIQNPKLKIVRKCVASFTHQKKIRAGKQNKKITIL